MKKAYILTSIFNVKFQGEVIGLQLSLGLPLLWLTLFAILTHSLLEDVKVNYVCMRNHLSSSLSHPSSCPATVTYLKPGSLGLSRKMLGIGAHGVMELCCMPCKSSLASYGLIVKAKCHCLNFLVDDESKCGFHCFLLWPPLCFLEFMKDDFFPSIIINLGHPSQRVVLLVL